MDLPKHLQQLLPICDEMGVSLYQRFSESDASSFLNIPIQSLQLIRGQNKISYLELNESQIEYFGYQLLEYLLGSITQALASVNPAPSSDRIIRSSEVTKITGLSRTSIWRKEKDRSFPARVSLGVGSVGWRLSEVETWINNRAKA